jgi:hypothetical protein
VEQRYGRTGQFWLPALNHSTADARIFGSTEVVIEYSDYKTNVRWCRSDAVAWNSIRTFQVPHLPEVHAPGPAFSCRIPQRIIR